jgi:hypothetical protein
VLDLRLRQELQDPVRGATQQGQVLQVRGLMLLQVPVEVLPFQTEFTQTALEVRPLTLAVVQVPQFLVERLEPVHRHRREGRGHRERRDALVAHLLGGEEGVLLILVPQGSHDIPEPGLLELVPHVVDRGVVERGHAHRAGAGRDDGGHEVEDRLRLAGPRGAPRRPTW